MPQTPKPWFRQQTGWWMAQVARKQVKLVPGPKNPATRTLARERLAELLRLAATNPAPGAGRQTVATVIDTYLRHARHHYSARTLYERTLILQDFAERHGWRAVTDQDCLP